MTNPELIDRLIVEASQAADWRSGCAREGYLPLFNNFGQVSYLSPAGDLLIDDLEDGPLRPADPGERDFALARAAENYPELTDLRPSRPQFATTCELCRGGGKVKLSQGAIVPWQGDNETRPFLYCPGCNSLGWTVTVAS